MFSCLLFYSLISPLSTTSFRPSCNFNLGTITTVFWIRLLMVVFCLLANLFSFTRSQLINGLWFFLTLFLYAALLPVHHTNLTCLLLLFVVCLFVCLNTRALALCFALTNQVFLLTFFLQCLFACLLNVLQCSTCLCFSLYAATCFHYTMPVCFFSVYLCVIMKLLKQHLKW